MKIYLVGAHSVGKSTLAEYISNKYNLPLLKEIAREILHEYRGMEIDIEKLRSDIDSVNEFQTTTLNRQFCEELKLADDFVSDRSFDSLAYTAQHSTNLFNTLNNNKILPGYIKSLKDNNVIIFFIRPTKATLKNDGVRENVNWEGIIAIDAMIKFLLEMYGLRYFIINTESMQERIRLTEAVISLISK